MATYPANGSNVDTWDATLKTYLDEELAQANFETAANWTSGDPTLAAGKFGVETDTGKVKIGDGSTAWTSLLYSIIPRAYGYMYAKNATIVVNIGLANTAYEITAGLTAGGSLSGVTFNSNHYLEVAKAGVYKITYSVSADVVAAGDQIEAGVMIDGSELAADGGGHGTIDTGDASDCVAGSTIVALSASAQISLFLRNHSGGNNITVEHLTCSVERIG